MGHFGIDAESTVLLSVMPPTALSLSSVANQLTLQMKNTDLHFIGLFLWHVGHMPVGILFSDLLLRKLNPCLQGNCGLFSLYSCFIYIVTKTKSFCLGGAKP